MTARKSFANCVTLGPMSPAPIRMTILLGRLVPRLPFSAASSLEICVLFFFLGLAIVFVAKWIPGKGECEKVGGRGEGIIVLCKDKEFDVDRLSLHAKFLEAEGVLIDKKNMR